MKKLIFVILLLLGFTLAETPKDGWAYVISAIGVKNSPNNVVYTSGDTSAGPNANYVLSPQVIVWDDTLDYVGSLTPFTGCLNSKHYTNGAPSGMCITGIINDLTTGGKDKALSAEQGKVLDGKIKDVADLIRTNVFKPYNTFTTYNLNGVTVTYNKDGTYTLNGTSNQDVKEWGDVGAFRYAGVEIGTALRDANKSYKVLGAPDIEGVFIGGQGIGKAEYEGKIVSNDVDTNFEVALCVKEGYTFNNVIVKPMITENLDASYEDFIPYEQSLATNNSVKDIVKWKLIYKDSVGPNAISLNIPDEYNELLFEYGTKNENQVYGGGSVVIVKNSNHPMWVPLFAWNKESFIDVVYAFWYGNILNINTTNSTINYQVWAR